LKTTVKERRSKKEDRFLQNVEPFFRQNPSVFINPSSFYESGRFFLSYQDKAKSLAIKKPVWPPHGLARNFPKKLP
jgi:hypothetical protein